MQLEQKEKELKGEKVGFIWPHGEKWRLRHGWRATEEPGAVRGLQAEVSSKTLAMRNRPWTSIHQLLVLHDHLYL